MSAQAFNAGTSNPPGGRTDDLRCTCYRVRRAARRLTQAYETALADCRLSPVQMAVAAELARSEPCSVVELADRLGTERSTLSRTVARMIEAGWIADGPSRDGRARGLTVTETGNAALIEAAGSWRRAEAAMVRRLGADGLSDLYRLLAQAEAAADLIDPR